MKSTIRERLAAKYLDWVEVLPRFGGGTLQRLQHLRERQRKDAKDTYDRTRFPPGVSLQFDQLFLIEIFLLEDYDNLIRQLRQLFPKGSSAADGLSEDHIQSFSDTAADLFAGGWILVGHITRKEAKPFFFPKCVVSIPTLPEEVNRIEVQLAKVLPSVFAVSFNIVLTDDATSKIRRLFNQSYLPHAVFGGTLPTRRNLNRWSQGSTGREMRREILGSLADLRLKIEKELSSTIRGTFLQLSDSKSPQLPAIEMFTIDGILATDRDGIGEKLKENKWWLNCLGIAHWRTDGLFTDLSVLFQWAESDDDFGVGPHRLLTIRHEAGDKGEQDKRLRCDDIAQSLSPLIAVLGLVEKTRQDAQLLRTVVLKTLSGKMSSRPLESEIRLNNKMQLHRMTLERLRFEMSESRQIMERRVYELREFLPIGNGLQNNLGASLLDGIDRRFKTVFGHSEMVSTQLSDYLQRRTLEIAYLLQKRFFWWSNVLMILTIVVSMIAAYGVVKDWPVVRHLMDWIQRCI